MKTPQRILLGRTDSIGDVVLTLPMAGALKRLFPAAEILFLGQTYTQPVIAACTHVDEFYNWDEVKDNPAAQADFLRATRSDVILHVFPHQDIARAAHAAKIPRRIGTTNRWFHWRTCNSLVWLSRRNSPLHEAQLNLSLLKPLGLNTVPARAEIAGLYGLEKLSPLNAALVDLLARDKFNLILHPTSRGSSLEWGAENFAALIRLLPQDKFHIFITGTEADGALVRDTLLRPFPFVTDMTGRLSLDELISFIAAADGLLAASTGPLHLAAALGINAIGLYASRRPLHRGRWAPLGEKVMVIEDGLSERYAGYLKIDPLQATERITRLILQ